MNSSSACPCNPDKSYQSCCFPIHNNEKTADTAEELMRSRYSAYALKNEQYLLKSWHSETRPSSIPFEDHVKWIGLKIKSKSRGTTNDSEGTVHFVARYKIAGKAYKLEENSQFYKIDDQWFYHAAL